MALAVFEVDVRVVRAEIDVRVFGAWVLCKNSVAFLGLRQFQEVQSFPVIPKHCAGILSTPEPQVVRLKFPGVGRGCLIRDGQWAKRLPIEPTDTLLELAAVGVGYGCCREVDVARLVFLNASYVIVVQPVFRREVDESLPIVAVHASVPASEPVVTILGVVNTPDGRVEFGNDLALGGGRLLVLTVGLRFGLGGRALVRSGGAGGQRGDEGESKSGATKPPGVVLEEAPGPEF